MRPAPARARPGPGAVLLAVLALLPACAVQEAARGQPGVDISSVRSDATRAQIEGRLGAAERQWTTPAGIVYRVYRYDVGIPGSRSGAAALVFGEIATLGLLELILKVEPGPSSPDWDPMRWRRLAVAYGPDDVAVGVFLDVGDLTVLPDDGRARSPPMPARP